MLLLLGLLALSSSTSSSAAAAATSNVSLAPLPPVVPALSTLIAKRLHSRISSANVLFEPTDAVHLPSSRRTLPFLDHNGRLSSARAVVYRHRPLQVLSLEFDFEIRFQPAHWTVGLKRQAQKFAPVAVQNNNDNDNAIYDDSLSSNEDDDDDGDAASEIQVNEETALATTLETPAAVVLDYEESNSVLGPIRQLEQVASPVELTYTFAPKLVLPHPDCFYNPSGYVCCNAHLHNLLEDTYHALTLQPNFSACNLMRIANRVQAAAERRFNVSYEAIVGLNDFAQAIHVHGTGVCKIEVDGRYILAYATPPGELSSASSEIRVLRQSPMRTTAVVTLKQVI